MAFSHICTFKYIGLVALLDRIQSNLSSITISTKATAPLFVASVSKQKLSAHFIAMAEMVGRSA